MDTGKKPMQLSAMIRILKIAGLAMLIGCALTQDIFGIIAIVLIWIGGSGENRRYFTWAGIMYLAAVINPIAYIVILTARDITHSEILGLPWQPGHDFILRTAPFLLLTVLFVVIGIFSLKTAKRCTKNGKLLE